MLRPTLAVLTAVLAAGPTRARPQVLASLEQEQHALFDRVAPSVVVVSAGDAVSAGFLAAPGLVVTSAHGLFGAREAQVTFRDGRTVRGEVGSSSPQGLDLALLRVPELPGERVLAPAGHAPLRTGDVVVAVGHGDGNRWSFSTGMVSNPLTDGALVRLQLPLRPGASGGPVVDRAGRLVGVVVSGDPSALAFAVRADAVVRAFPELVAASASAEEPAPASPPERVAAATPPPLPDLLPLALPGGEGESVVAQPVRAPELIVAPPDPRPAPARVVRVSRIARETPARAKARAAPLRHETPAARAVVLPADPQAGGLARELRPVGLLGVAGLALAALVGAVLLGASSLWAVRVTTSAPRARRARFERRRAPSRARPGAPHRV